MVLLFQPFQCSVFFKSLKPANFVVYYGIFSGYFFLTKIDRYFFGTSCTCFGIVFILVPYLIVCALAHFFRFETGKPVITRSKSFPRFNPSEFSVLNILVNMYNYLTPQTNVRNGWNIINMSKRTILDFFQSGPKAKQSRGLYFFKFMKWINKTRGSVGWACVAHLSFCFEET
jgi:hypothetical protein